MTSISVKSENFINNATNHISLVSYKEQKAKLKRTREFIKKTWRTSMLRGQMTKKDFDRYIKNLKANDATKAELDKEKRLYEENKKS